MVKGGFLTPKAIGNRIKAKGLQKLRWYCEMCQKQCNNRGPKRRNSQRRPLQPVGKPCRPQGERSESGPAMPQPRCTCVPLQPIHAESDIKISSLSYHNA